MSSIQYQRLGHFSLSDNTKNNYKSRELKSVFLDHQWKYLKILFNKPYFNKFNPFNQIGVVRIVCHGVVLNDYEGNMKIFNVFDKRFIHFLNTVNNKKLILSK